MENNFYVYAYLRKNNDSPYYIGKGKNNRAYVKHGKIKVPDDKNKIKIISENLSEKEAFELEKYYISMYKLKSEGGILLNSTHGGEGVSGYKHSEETKKHFSESRKGENNPFYGKSHSSDSIYKIVTGNKEKNSGENNPFYGKSHNENTKKIMSEKRKGKEPHNKNKIKLYNKTTNKYKYVDNIENIESDWITSHTPDKFNSKNKIWIFNENTMEQLYIDNNESIPIGWKKGFIKGLKKHSEETKKHLSKVHTGKKGTTTGKVYINNGEYHKLICKTDDIPHGWIKGRLKIKDNKH